MFYKLQVNINASIVNAIIITLDINILLLSDLLIAKSVLDKCNDKITIINTFMVIWFFNCLLISKYM
jgi:hypothetical protein